MNIAFVLDKLVPGGDWQGSLTSNTRESYDSLRWSDDRKKPTWDEIIEAWPDIESEQRAQETEVRMLVAIAAKLPEILEQHGSAAVKAAIAAIRKDAEDSDQG